MRFQQKDYYNLIDNSNKTNNATRRKDKRVTASIKVAYHEIVTALLLNIKMEFSINKLLDGSIELY